jgi:hypothetical protein
VDGKKGKTEAGGRRRFISSWVAWRARAAREGQRA